ncbi:class I SAM-dependent DNA methyltransferase [Ornithinimicrobium pekingense]|uniref:Methyltransferase n=1 Tax=Ornithinimicrobium pekingense TaxID=384677 RepID=A0ABQ2FCV1_9MICO|nr:class I SAM-dependent methyltransferase [Ornithinimicrobium pekingense]GGK73283.1 methyltransferase [Ornithinimicrobium pekingense]
MGSEHFDEKAADWDSDPDKVARARDVARAVAANVPFGADARLLEYGAGTGLVTQALLGRVGQVTLADSSPGMRAVAQQKIADGALPPDARVWDLDLEHQTAPPGRFDLIVSSLVLHHVRTLRPVLEGLVSMLEPGGHLCVADLDAEDGSFHGHRHDFDGHDGFDRGDLSRSLEAAGLTDVVISDCTTILREGRPYSVFLATARKPVD